MSQKKEFSMSTQTLYHNPRCSKSRQTLELLKRRGLEPKIVEYLDAPPTLNELRDLHNKLGQPAKVMIRTNEAEYKELAIDIEDDEQVLEAIARHPKLLERPIFVSGSKAAIGRPPENVLTVL